MTGLPMNQTLPPEKLLVRKPEMASMLGIGERTLENWIASRKVRYIRIGGTVLFDPKDVLEDVKAFQVSAAHGR